MKPPFLLDDRAWLLLEEQVKNKNFSVLKNILKSAGEKSNYIFFTTTRPDLGHKLLLLTASSDKDIKPRIIEKATFVLMKSKVFIFEENYDIGSIKINLTILKLAFPLFKEWSQHEPFSWKYMKSYIYDEAVSSICSLEESFDLFHLAYETRNVDFITSVSKIVLTRIMESSHKIEAIEEFLKSVPEGDMQDYFIFEAVGSYFRTLKIPFEKKEDYFCIKLNAIGYLTENTLFSRWARKAVLEIEIDKSCHEANIDFLPLMDACHFSRIKYLALHPINERYVKNLLKTFPNIAKISLIHWTCPQTLFEKILNSDVKELIFVQRLNQNQLDNVPLFYNLSPSHKALADKLRGNFIVHPSKNTIK